jgi:hypothetical protein
MNGFLGAEIHGSSQWNGRIQGLFEARSKKNQEISLGKG